MKDWLKNNPLGAMLINGLISVLGLLFMFWITNRHNIEASTLKTIESKVDKTEYLNFKKDQKNRDERQDDKIEAVRLETKSDNERLEAKIDNLTTIALKIYNKK